MAFQSTEKSFRTGLVGVNLQVHQSVRVMLPLMVGQYYKEHVLKVVEKKLMCTKDIAIEADLSGRISNKETFG